MKHDYKAYIIITIIFLLSFVGSYLFREESLLSAVMAAPGVIALLSALFQLIRDQAAFEKQLEIQQKQFQFTLGAASHMANRAFDMHVEFCEKYMTEIHNILHALYRDAETYKQVEQANQLYKLREDYAVWLTNEINENLEKFEVAIRRLGADAYFISSTSGSKDYASKRAIKIESSFELFNEILGIDKSKELNEDYAIDSIKRKVKEVLGIEELTSLRKHLIHEASNVLKNNA